MKRGKKEFYPLVRESLIQKGYRVLDGDTELKGKGRGHLCRPDLVITKDEGMLALIEVKSEKEGPKSGNWRIPQPSDSEEFKAIRLRVADQEKTGVLSRELGGFEIVILGQLGDYIRKVGTTYILPPELASYHTLYAGLSVPVCESKTVQEVLDKTQCKIIDTIVAEGVAVTYIFSLAQ